MSLVFTSAGINAINVSRSNGFLLDLVSFKVSDGTSTPTTADTAAIFENTEIPTVAERGTVHFTGTIASGHISNKRIIDDNTFNIDVIVPPEQPTSGGSFNIRKLGLYVNNPDPSPPAGQEHILLASTLFDGNFEKFAPSATNAGNSLILTITIGFDNATAAINVLDSTQRDWNFYAEYTTVDIVPNPAVSADRTVRVTRASSLFPSAGHNTYLMHNTNSGGVSVPEWIPDNHSLVFPIHALPSVSAGVPSHSLGSTVIPIVYNSNTLDDADTHVMNSIPPAQDGLLISIQVQDSNGQPIKEIRQVTAVQQHIDLDTGSTTTGREVIKFLIANSFTTLPAVNTLFKIWSSNTTLTPGSGGGGGGAVLDATHEAIAEKVMRRDDNGQARVQTLTDGQSGADPLDIINRQYAANLYALVQASFAQHDSSSSSHANLFSNASTANKAIMRDSGARAYINNPTQDGHIANKVYVDTSITTLENNISSQILSLMNTAIDTYITANIDTYVDPKITQHNADTNAHADLFQEAAIGGTAAVRDSSGRLKAQNPNAPEDVVTLSYWDANSTTSGESDKILKLDSAGMGRVSGNATANEDIVNKAYLEATLSSNTSIFGSLVSVNASNDTIVKRDANGRAFVAAPTDDGHAVNLGYLQDNYSVINPSTGRKQGDLLFLPDTSLTNGVRVYVYLSATSTVQIFPAQYT